MRALELTRGGIVGTLAVLVVAVVCVRLGLWQLDRRAERQARNAAVAARLADPEVALMALPTDTTGLTYRRVQLVGAVDDDRAIVLAGRSLNGAPGVHMLSPFRMGDGAILVNRGWLPAADGASADLARVRLSGRYHVEGVLMPFPDVDVDTEPQGFRERWFRVDGNAIRAQYPYAVAPLYLQASVRPDPVGGDTGTGAGGDTADGDPEDRARGGPPVPLARPTLDPGPHLSYAIQWFSFAGIFLAGWLVLLLRRGRTAEPPAEPTAGPG